MAITKMNSFTLLTFRDKKSRLLKDLQKFGDVHFRDLSRDELMESGYLKQDFSQEDITRCESELDKVGFALSKLAPHVPKSGLTAKRKTLSYEEFDGFLSGYDYGKVCGCIKEQDDLLAGYRSEISRLRAEIEGLKAWLSLDVSPAELDGLSVARYLVGTVNKTTADSFKVAMERDFPCVYVEFLGSTKDDMAMLILIDPDSYEDVLGASKDLGFSRANLGFRERPTAIVKANEAKIKELELQITAANDAVKARAEEHGSLLIVKDCLRTTLEREKAAQNFLGSETVVFLEGWVPEEDNANFHKIITAACGEDYYLEEAAVEEDSEVVPIKLKNNRLVAAFESITSMYSLPRYNEFDPTPLMMPFYWLFFGLMVGDIGYGLLLMIGTFAASRLLDLKPGMKSFMRFFFYLSFAIVAAGFLYGSCFGYSVFTPLTGPDGQPKAIIDSQMDIVTMIIGSIAIGVVHVLFGVAVKGALCIKRGDIAGAIFDSLFWILAVLSGIGLIIVFMVPGMLPDPLPAICSWVFLASLIGLAATQGRSSPSLGGKIGNGLYGVYGITSYVGDLVSYTRIVALALSGAYIAFSFNLMRDILPGGFVKIVFGSIIFVAGQALNFGLSLLSAYVHTCRLQYVEYFGKFYEGGGKPFKPLTIQHDSVHINN